MDKGCIKLIHFLLVKNFYNSCTYNYKCLKRVWLYQQNPWTQILLTHNGRGCYNLLALSDHGGCGDQDWVGWPKRWESYHWSEKGVDKIKMFQCKINYIFQQKLLQLTNTHIKLVHNSHQLMRVRFEENIQHPSLFFSTTYNII